MSHAGIVSGLVRLTDKEFVEVVYRAIGERREIDGELGRRFVLAERSRDPDENQDPTFIGLPDPQSYESDWAADCPFCQTGQCAVCGNLIVGIAKLSICPMCETLVHCT